MTPPPRRVGLADMLRAGGRAVSAYTGTFFALFLIQALVAFGAGLVIERVLASAFATRPLFDEGVDGDLLALIEALRGAGATIQAIGWIGFGAIALWMVLSWFLVGGLIAVLHERPRGRRDTARVFGAGGGGQFFVMLRLGVISLALHVVVLFVLMRGLISAGETMDHALTFREVIVSLILGITPSILLTVVLWTILDHARVELVTRRATHERLGAVQAFLRAASFVFRRPVTLLHTGLWAIAFLAISVLYVYAAWGHAMLGTSGALALLGVREGLALARMGLKVALIGGQVELGLTRTPPPRTAATVEGE